MEASKAMIQLNLPSEERLSLDSFKFVGSTRSPHLDRDCRDKGEKPSSSKLDAFAREWDPITERASPDDRCLYITFSNGYPLAEHQIIRFFNYKFGECVERAYVHQPLSNGKTALPLFGKVVFTASCIPAMILGGDGKIKFIVEGKPLWCKRFEPKNSSVRKMN